MLKHAMIKLLNRAVIILGIRVGNSEGWLLLLLNGLKAIICIIQRSEHDERETENSEISKS
jgi:hypothetical protein